VIGVVSIHACLILIAILVKIIVDIGRAFSGQVAPVGTHKLLRFYPCKWYLAWSDL